MPVVDTCIVKNIHFVSQNVNRKFEHTATMLEELRSSSDVIMIQEPPWRMMRMNLVAISSLSMEQPEKYVQFQLEGLSNCILTDSSCSGRLRRSGKALIC